MEVFTLVFDFPVFFSYAVLSLIVVLRTLMRLFVVLFPGKRFLQFPEALFVYFDKSRVRDRE